MKIKFRYQYKGELDPKFFNNPLYETVFLDKDGNWKSVKKVVEHKNVYYPLAAFQYSEKEEIAAKSSFTKEPLSNFYEYEIDIAPLKRKPAALRALNYLLLFNHMNDKYIQLTSQFFQDVRIDKEVRKEYIYGKLDYYGGMDSQHFRLELGLFFPETYRALPSKMFDTVATFRFILDRIDFNKLLKKQLDNYNAIKNELRDAYKEKKDEYN